jgi:hypothetical protein
MALKIEDRQALTGHHQVREEGSIAAVPLHTTTGLLHLRRLVTSRIGGMAETTTEGRLMKVRDTACLRHQVKAGTLFLDHLATVQEASVQSEEIVESHLLTHMSQPTLLEEHPLETTGDHGTQMTVLEKVGVAPVILANPETNMKTTVLTEADRTEKETRGTLRKADEMGGQGRGAPSDETGTATVIETTSIGGRKGV